jgi:hypothetical protein
MGRSCSGDRSSNAIPKSASSSIPLGEPKIAGCRVVLHQATRPRPSNTRPEGSSTASATRVPGVSPSSAHPRSPPIPILVQRDSGAIGFPSSVFRLILAKSGMRSPARELDRCCRIARVMFGRPNDSFFSSARNAESLERKSGVALFFIESAAWQGVGLGTSASSQA